MGWEEGGEDWSSCGWEMDVCVEACGFVLVSSRDGDDDENQPIALVCGQAPTSMTKV